MRSILKIAALCCALLGYAVIPATAGIGLSAAEDHTPAIEHLQDQFLGMLDAVADRARDRENPLFQIQSLHGVSLGMSFEDAMAALAAAGFEPLAGSDTPYRSHVAKGYDGQPEILRRFQGKNGKMEAGFAAYRAPDAAEDAPFTVYSVYHRDDFRGARLLPHVDDIFAEVYARAQIEEASCTDSYTGQYREYVMIDADWHAQSPGFRADPDCMHVAKQQPGPARFAMSATIEGTTALNAPGRLLFTTVSLHDERIRADLRAINDETYGVSVPTLSNF